MTRGGEVRNGRSADLQEMGSAGNAVTGSLGMGLVDWTRKGAGSDESLLLVYCFPGSTQLVCVPSECLQVLEAGFLG